MREDTQYVQVILNKTNNWFLVRNYMKAGQKTVEDNNHSSWRMKCQPKTLYLATESFKN